MFKNNRVRVFYLSGVLSLAVFTPAFASALSQLSFQFYDQELTVAYESEMLYQQQIRVDELALRRSYNELNHLPYQAFLSSLQATAQALVLNDWLYSELLEQSLTQLYGKAAADPMVQLSKYFFLAKSGYDVRLTYRDTYLQVNVHTEDVLYEIPLIQESGRQYANISPARSGRTSRSMYILDHRPTPTGRSFSFTIEEWPKLLQHAKKRTLSFPFEGDMLEVSIAYNSGVAAILENYPLVSEHWYLDAPLSEALSASLLPQLEVMIRGRSLRKSLELLVSFTRSAFDYKDDKETFGTNKPMVADELFFYPFSDCEDRSALFYTLVKHLLDLPMIVVAYEDHLSIAVAAPDLQGDSIRYQGKKYLFCDPTGPQGSSRIGEVPPGYENKSFEIIGVYPKS